MERENHLERSQIRKGHHETVLASRTYPHHLHAALRLLADEYPLHEAVDGTVNLSFLPGTGRRLRTARHCLRGSPSAAVRRGATACARKRAGRAGAGGHADHRSHAVHHAGIMLDCSRNAVMRVEHVKRWLRRLALLGYNQVMLYTEDTYEIPGEPRFGFQRGRYTQAELRELDAYAARLNMELVGCIQTLAHLEQILRWGEYHAVKDYESVLLVGEPATYEPSERCSTASAVRCAPGAFTSAWTRPGPWAVARTWTCTGRRASSISSTSTGARGRALWRARPAADDRSDMYFAMGSPSHGYYDTACVIRCMSLPPSPRWCSSSIGITITKTRPFTATG